MSNRLSRRMFLAAASGVSVTAGFPRPLPSEQPPHPSSGFRGDVVLFSKPLPQMDWQRLAENVKRLGFDGIDLTVRPEGHVLPERVAEDLPKAVAAIRSQGLSVPMITTGLTSASDPAARPTFETAAPLSIRYLKPGYYHYQLKDVRSELRRAGEELRGLVELAKQYRVEIGFHNHEEYVGAPVWDVASVIEPLDPAWIGYYFDVRHATAEGGAGCWKISTNLVSERLKMLAVKDFFWQKTAKGWRDANCPLGEGMVNWKYFFAQIARVGFHGPISLHLEYEVPGATPAEKEKNTLAAAKRDLEFLRARLREAYGG
ncbi:MAG: sugar phosphate isomerase/epimerase [Acidobacteria bacterium]|nr:MAG: sugar phosphate isomerase/epimerase [Acidobacteriota bacterium]